jgi:hypothetical protein
MKVFDESYEEAAIKDISGTTVEARTAYDQSIDPSELPHDLGSVTSCYHTHTDKERGGRYDEGRH